MPRSTIPPLLIRRVLSSRPDPLDILKTTAPVIEGMRQVSISQPRIASIAKVLGLRPLSVPEWNHDLHFFDGSERTLVYLILLDALNFSFWGEPRWTVDYSGNTLDGYWALAASLKRAAVGDVRILDPRNLASLSPIDLSRILNRQSEIPMFVDRWRNAQEVGRVLIERFGGRASLLVESANRDAGKLARTVAEEFRSFHDTSIYDTGAVNFFKRAQIVVADIAGAFNGKGFGNFKSLAGLTVFADYKLPQILRAWEVLKYKKDLARRVDAGEELEKDSEEEVEIRSATIWSSELLRLALAKSGRKLTSAQLDWFLWNASHHTRTNMKPHHRVRTIYY